MKEQKFNVEGIAIPRNWELANCTTHPDVIAAVTKKISVIIVIEHKLKVFGIDKNGILRKNSWPLGTEHHMIEANIILSKKLGVSLPIPKTEGEILLEKFQKQTKKQTTKKQKRAA